MTLTEEVSALDTADIQHDLALLLLDEIDDELTQAYDAELIRRGASLPCNVQPSRFNRSVSFELQERRRHEA